MTETFHKVTFENSNGNVETISGFYADCECDNSQWHNTVLNAVRFLRNANIDWQTLIAVDGKSV